MTEEPFVISGGKNAFEYCLILLTESRSRNAIPLEGQKWRPSMQVDCFLISADLLKLLVRRGDLPSKDGPQSNPWTTFEMTLREQGPVPQPFDLTRFLASSITFMVHLRSVSVFFDSHRLAHLTKSPGVPRELGLPKVLKRSSGSGLMSVKSVQSAGEHLPLLLVVCMADGLC